MSIVYHERYMDHRQGSSWHPEAPERLQAIVDRLQEEGLWKDVLRPGAADREDLLRIHTEEYLDLLKNFGVGPLDPDTYMHEDTYDIALLSAGGGILAGETSYGEGRPMIALLRPPGHHATPYRAMGFCYLNNIAISAARTVAKERGRVAIVDIDLHHGNGTNDAFYETDDVLYISTHQYPHFPGTGTLGTVGKGDGRGYTVNIPLHRGCGDSTFEYIFDRLVEPITRQFEPSAILVSYGGDALYDDPLGGLALSAPGFIDLVDRLLSMAKELCDDRITFFLEGGYNLKPLGEITAGIVAGFHGKKIPLEFTRVSDDDIRGRSVVDEVISVMEGYWDI